MHREHLPETGGMLFIYPEDRRPAFWMKNMKLALDFVWMNSDGKVVDTSENVPVCETSDCPSISAKEPVRYVLEIAAGSIQRAGIKTGDQATIVLSGD